jgi:hypothetical protein
VSREVPFSFLVSKSLIIIHQHITLYFLLAYSLKVSGFSFRIIASLTFFGFFRFRLRCFTLRGLPNGERLLPQRLCLVPGNLVTQNPFVRAARKCELISRSAVHQSRSRVVRPCLHSFISIAAFTILLQAHSQTFFSAVSALRKASYGTQQSMTWPVKMATITTPIRKLGDNIKLLTKKLDAVWPLNNI